MVVNSIRAVALPSYIDVVRGFLIGLVLLLGVSLSILSLRPGGLRYQLRQAARRFRLFLMLGGIYVLGSEIIRLVSPTGPVADYAPPLLAIALVGAFLIFGRDPAAPTPESSPPPRTP